jgi:hypothetical protein
LQQTGPERFSPPCLTPLFAAETLLRLLFGDTLPYTSFYNASSPLESSSRFKLML